jgi:hypothetical protein
MKDDRLFHRALSRIARHSFYFERLNVASHVEGLHFRQKMKQYTLISVPEGRSHNFAGQGYSFSLLYWRCRVKPFHVLSFRFWAEMVQPASITSHNDERSHCPQQHIIKGAVMIHPCVSFCVHL